MFDALGFVRGVIFFSFEGGEEGVVVVFIGGEVVVAGWHVGRGRKIASSM